MSILTKNKVTAKHDNGFIVVMFDGGVEIKFPVTGNPRLSVGSSEQLSNIEVSPFGLHWPDLDEDLSFEGLKNGKYGR